MTSLKSARILILTVSSLLTGCANSVLENLSESLAVALLDQNDIDLVRDGLPAYLLIADGMIEQNPDNPDILLSSARLYAFYASEWVDNPTRANALTEKARDYAKRGLCSLQTESCQIDALRYDEFIAALQQFDANHIDELYHYALTWAAWLKAHQRDWHAIAERPKLEALFERLLELDETYDSGRIHYYLGILRTQLSPAQGGNPEIGKQHFERAVELSKGQDLAVKVAYARLYARMFYDRELHDRLLGEVLQADPKVPGLTLSNTLAQQQARQLLNDSDDYFQE